MHNANVFTDCKQDSLSRSVDVLSPFEVTWQQLRAAGHEGWGGSAFADRIQAWKNDLHHPFLANWLEECPRHILEVGCGNGHVGAILAGKGHKVIGIDSAPTAIEWARESWRSSGLSLEFIRASAEAVGSVWNSCFDLVIDSNCIHCLKTTERAEAIKGFAHALKSDGLLLVSCMILPVRDLGDELKYDPIGGRIYNGRGLERYIIGLEDLRHELQASHLVPIEVDQRRRTWWDHLFLLARKVTGEQHDQQ